MTQKPFKVGFTSPAGAANGVGLGVYLDRLQRLGVDSVELPMYWLDLLVGARRKPLAVRRLMDACRDRPFGFSAHLPLSINFMDRPERLSRHFDVFQASLDLAAEAGAEHMVIHTGLLFDDTLADIDGAYARQRAYLARAADAAAERGATICVENLFRWDAVRHTATPARLAAELRAIDHPHLGATFDFSHGFIHAGQEGFDFLDQAERLAPLSIHTHMHDSFGRPDDGMYFYSDSERIAFGSGDLHLTVGHGAIPWDALIARCRFPEGAIFNIELNDRYFDDEAAECIAAVRAIVARLNATRPADAGR